MRKTYIINIDGMRADYFNSWGHQGCLTKTLCSLAKDGVRFTNCKAIMPANTGTNHTAIMTGFHAGSHGILGVGGCYKGLDESHPRISPKYGMPITGMFEHKHLQVPSFFNVIKKRNPDLVTAFITGKTWLGDIIPDEDCDVTIYPGNTPEMCGVHKPNPEYVTECGGYLLGGPAHPEDNEMLPRYYFPKETEVGKEPPETFSAALVNVYAHRFPSDEWIIDHAIKCVQHDDPDFMYMVLMNMDMAGHLYGAFLPDKNPDETDGRNLCPLRNPCAVKDQLYITDEQIGRFIDYLKKRGVYEDARIIITSDHGMNTTKSMFSGISKKRMLYWILDKIHLINWSEVYRKFLLSKIMEELDIDIRRILAQHGIHMRASQGRWSDRYKKEGKYDWCYSDGGIVTYIYNVDIKTQRKIKEILLNYTIKENGKTEKPIWQVLTEDELDRAINPYTNQPFRMGRGNFNHEYDAQWPSIIVFLKPHYMSPLYNDQIYAGLLPLMIKINLPHFVDLRISGGLHGTYLEQDVPLIFVSPAEIQHSEQQEQTSVVDIVPTINRLNGWPDPTPPFEGKPLF